MTGSRCLRCGTRVGWVGAIVDTMLVGVKLFVGFKTGSRALMADALYSIIDVISALLVIGSYKISRKGADDDHAYGHGKVEFLAVAAVSLCVAGLAVILLHGAIDDLIVGGHEPVPPVAAAASLLAIGACVTVSRYAKCAGTRLGSPVILTHAEHNKADAISSFAVLLTILLSWCGLGFLDSLVAMAEVFHVLYVSARLFRRGADGLLDASIGALENAEIAGIACDVPGVLGVDRVRARNLGSSIWVELTVRVAPGRRMLDVGGIRSMIRSRIAARIEHVANVVIEVLPATAATGHRHGCLSVEGKT